MSFDFSNCRSRLMSKLKMVESACTVNKQPPSKPALRPVGLYQAFLFWFKLGFISFGGPAGQISIQRRI